MKIIYDDIIFSLQRTGGIPVYWSQLLKHLPKDMEREDLISKGIIPRPLGRKVGGVGDMFPHRYVI